MPCEVAQKSLAPSRSKKSLTPSRSTRKDVTPERIKKSPSKSIKNSIQKKSPCKKGVKKYVNYTDYESLESAQKFLDQLEKGKIPTFKQFQYLHDY